MASSRKVTKNDSEFGDGKGLIDPIRRAERVVGQEATALGVQRLGEELLEIYATNPANPNSEPATSDLKHTKG